MTEPIQRRGEWWQQSPSGSWLKWNEDAQNWEDQPSPPPPPDTTPAASGQAPTAPGFIPQGGPAPTHGSAIGSLVLGILWLGGIGSIIAVILGFKAKSEIDRSQGTVGGRGMAIAGIVLGFVGIAGAILTAALIFAAGSAVDSQLEKRYRAEMESALKNAATAEESYLTVSRQGTYTSSLEVLENEGLFVSPDISLRIEVEGGTRYCIEATHDQLPDEVTHYDSDEGQPLDGPC